MTDLPRERFGLTREELSEVLANLSDGYALVEEPLDSELWPTEGLTDRQIELLTRGLQKVEKAKSREQFLGRLGLK